MGLTYKSHILASHLNMILVRAPPKFTKHPLLYLQSLLPLSAAETAGLQRMQQFAAEGTGYSKLQTTKPHTLGFALADSPVALLAWVYEKLHDWTDGYPWTDDEILTWVSLYQFSRAGPDASVRIYYEAVHATDHRTLATTQYNGAVKLGLSYFPKDVILPPASGAEPWGTSSSRPCTRAVATLLPMKPLMHWRRIYAKCSRNLGSPRSDIS